jgi:hypothetical protein
VIGRNHLVGERSSFPKPDERVIVSVVGQRGENIADPLVHRFDLDPDVQQVPDVLVQIQDRSTDLVGDLLGWDPEHGVDFGVNRQRNAARWDRHAEVDIEAMRR